MHIRIESGDSDWGINTNFIPRKDDILRIQSTYYSVQEVRYYIPLDSFDDPEDVKAITVFVKKDN